MGSREFVDYKAVASTMKEEPNLLSHLDITNEYTLILADKISHFEEKIQRLNFFVPKKETGIEDLKNDGSDINGFYPPAMARIVAINKIYLNQLERIDDLMLELEKITG